MASPTAHTPGSPVRQPSSTSMKPRSEIVHAGAVEPEVVGVRRRPTETTTTSTSRPSPPTCTVVPLPVGAWPSTVTPVRIVDAAALERLLDDLGDVLVEAGEDLGQRLEDRDLGAEVGEHRRELAADDAAADDGGALGQLGDRQELVGGHDDRAVDVEAGQRAGHRARGQHDGVAGELEVAGGAAGHGDPLAGVEAAVAVEHRDLAALQQRAEPGHEAVDDRVLAGERGAPVDRRPRRR